MGVRCDNRSKDRLSDLDTDPVLHRKCRIWRKRVAKNVKTGKPIISHLDLNGKYLRLRVRKIQGRKTCLQKQIQLARCVVLTSQPRKEIDNQSQSNREKSTETQIAKRHEQPHSTNTRNID